MSSTSSPLCCDASLPWLMNFPGRGFTTIEVPLEDLSLGRQRQPRANLRLPPSACPVPSVQVQIPCLGGTSQTPSAQSLDSKPSALSTAVHGVWPSPHAECVTGQPQRDTRPQGKQREADPDNAKMCTELSAAEGAIGMGWRI